MKRITLQDIRNKYPSPVDILEEPLDEEGNYNYCVGGAFCQFVEDRPPTIKLCFPRQQELAHVLSQKLQLDMVTAEKIAEDIVHLNDVGKMEEAWSRLGDAISQATFDDTTNREDPS